MTDLLDDWQPGDPIHHGRVGVSVSRPMLSLISLPLWGSYDDAASWPVPQPQWDITDWAGGP